MCPWFYLNNFDSNPNNPWVLDRLCAARSGDAHLTGDPFLGERLHLLRVVITSIAATHLCLFI